MSRTRGLLLLTVAVGSAACRTAEEGCDSGPCDSTSAPVVAWISPGEGSSSLVGSPLRLVVAASDAEDAVEDLELRFSSDVDGVLPGEGGWSDGRYTWEIPGHLLTGGAQSLTVRVTDSDGLVAEAVRALELNDNRSPQIQIIEPLGVDPLSAREPIRVEATASDPDDLDPTTLAVAWSILGADQPDMPVRPEPDGSLIGFLPGLRPGSYTLSARVTDTLGGQSSSEASFVVVAQDADGDGHTALIDGGDDCDDTRSDVNPNAEERCNGLDDDCDGRLDPSDATDAALWYLDADGDGFGAEAEAVLSCEAPERGVSDAGDCDDTRSTVHPGAEERCNDLDDDCSGSIDDNPVDGLVLYGDRDLDGYGSATELVGSCSLTAGLSEEGTDCDDTSAAAFPGADELCGTGVDEDCDGAADEDCGQSVCSGNITVLSSPTVWQSGEQIEVSCLLDVRTTLTIEDDVVVRFKSGAQLRVGNGGAGRLVVNGGSNGVLMRPQVPSEYAGALWFGSEHDESTISGLTLERTAINQSGIHITHGTVEIWDSLILEPRNATAGVYAGLGASVRFERSSVVDAWGSGLVAVRGATLLGLSDSRFVGNLGHPIRLPFSSAGQVDETIEAHDNGEDAFDLYGDDSTQDVHMRALDLPWHFDGVGRVAGSTGPTLTVDAGARVTLGSNSRLEIGKTLPGSIVIDAATDPVVFEPDISDAEWGHWQGIYVYPDAERVELDGLELHNAGRVGAALTVASPLASLSNLTVTQSGGDGVYLGVGTETTLDSVSIVDVTSLGIEAHPSAVVTLDAVEIAGAGQAAASLPASAIGEIGPDCHFDATDPWIEVTTGSIDRDTTWVPQDLPYRLAGRVLVGASVPPTLTLADGVEVLVGTTGSSIETLAGSGLLGQLVVDGHTQGVSILRVPEIAAWNGVKLYGGQHHLTGLDIDGGAGAGNIWLGDNAHLVADRLYSHDSAFAGLNLTYASSDVEIIDSRFEDHDSWGIYLRSAQIKRLSDSTFLGNGIGPIAIDAGSLGALDDSNTISGNGRDEISLNLNPTNLRDGDFIWRDAGVPYRLEGNLYAWGLSDSTPAKLTVESGVTIHVVPSYGLGCWPYATLHLLGTESDPIRIASTTGSPIDWEVIPRHGACTELLQEHVEID